MCSFISCSYSFVDLCYICEWGLMNGKESRGTGEAYDISFTASDVCVCLGTCSAAAIIDCWLNILARVRQVTQEGLGMQVGFTGLASNPEGLCCVFVVIATETNRFVIRT